MSATLRTGIIMVAITIIVAGFCGWLGVQYGLAHARQASNLDELVHHELDLTPAQDTQIRTLESQFASERLSLETQMRQANRDLAAAINEHHAFDDKCREAIERFHVAMRALQEATIVHVLAMRGVLTPPQAQKFDDMIRHELTVE